jgi:hypothetical protein
MAADGEIQGEMKGHAKSYSQFAAMMKWGAIISFVTAMLVILIISE